MLHRHGPAVAARSEAGTRLPGHRQRHRAAAPQNAHPWAHARRHHHGHASCPPNAHRQAGGYRRRRARAASSLDAHLLAGTRCRRRQRHSAAPAGSARLRAPGGWSGPCRYHRAVPSYGRARSPAHGHVPGPRRRRARALPRAPAALRLPGLRRRHGVAVRSPSRRQHRGRAAGGRDARLWAPGPPPGRPEPHGPASGRPGAGRGAARPASLRQRHAVLLRCGDACSLARGRSFPPRRGRGPDARPGNACPRARNHRSGPARRHQPASGSAAGCLRPRALSPGRPQRHGPAAWRAGGHRWSLGRPFAHHPCHRPAPGSRRSRRRRLASGSVSARRQACDPSSGHPLRYGLVPQGAGGRHRSRCRSADRLRRCAPAPRPWSAPAPGSRCAPRSRCAPSVRSRAGWRRRFAAAQRPCGLPWPAGRPWSRRRVRGPQVARHGGRVSSPSRCPFRHQTSYSRAVLHRGP